MNELIIFGIICGALVLLCAATAIIENAEAIAMWLWDVQTAYWKFRAHRERKNKQYLNTRKETNL